MFKHISYLCILLCSTFAVAHTIPEISQQQLQALTSAGKPAVVILDVRTPEEYHQGHVPGAINISHTQIIQHLSKLEPFKNQPIVVYCRSGKRAAIAEKILTAHGFKQLKHLTGDMNGWQTAQLPIEKSQP